VALPAARREVRLTPRERCYNVGGNMELKLRKIGNSYGVILPAEVLETLQVREGGKLTLLPNDKGFQLSIEDAEFEEQMRRARSLMARYRQTLRELAK
jgi:putative addiction module antidote